MKTTTTFGVKTVLVTGCAGFIGSNFVHQFRQQFPQATIVGIDDFSTGRASEVDSNIIFYKGSILDSALINKTFAEHKPEYVFHFAALPRVSYSVEQPVHTTEANILGTVLLLTAAKDNGVKRFMFSSSCAVYGDVKKLPIKEDYQPLRPKTPYAVQKLAIEPFCAAFSELYGMDTVSLRYFNVYGPGQYGDSPYSTVISSWLEALYFPKTKKPFIEGDGKQSRDFCYIDNIVDANILAMKSSRKLMGDVFNVGNDERITVKEIKKLIEKFSGSKLDLEVRPPRKGDIKHTQADITKAKKVLGYKPKISFEEGLKRTVSWFEERKKAEGKEVLK